jgi:23S rRNA (guanosine2251-2'-O)-methyltransferase
MENRKRGGIDGTSKYGSNRDSRANQPKKYFKPQNSAPRPHASSLVFGVQAILESLKSGKEIERILIQREFGQAEIEKLAKEREIPVQRVPVEKLNRITTKNHQGLIAFVSAINYAKLSNVIASIYEKGEVPLILVLDRITDVRNFGAIARTAECTGVHTIVVPARNAAQINADAMKTSSGALNYLPVCRENSLSQVLEELQQSGIQVIASTEKSENSLYDIDFTIPTAILMGSEEDGISEYLLQEANHSVKIPMAGQIASLNVSVATGVLLYEVVRQRMV